MHFHETLKCVNHGKKIMQSEQFDEPWSQEVLVASKLKNVCRIAFGYIDHDLYVPLLRDDTHRLPHFIFLLMG